MEWNGVLLAEWDLYIPQLTLHLGNISEVISVSISMHTITS